MLNNFLTNKNVDNYDKMLKILQFYFKKFSYILAIKSYYKKLYIEILSNNII